MTLAHPEPPSPRLGASPVRGPGDNRPPKGYRRVCVECGEPFEALRSFGGFCCSGHRKDWNNRRMKRGAELYDLVMAWRYQRGLSKALGLWKLVCRLAQAFRAEDLAERSGRQSWRSPKDVLAERPWLYATVMHPNINPKKPGRLVK